MVGNLSESETERVITFLVALGSAGEVKRKGRVGRWESGCGFFLMRDCVFRVFGRCFDFMEWDIGLDNMENHFSPLISNDRAYFLLIHHLLDLYIRRKVRILLEALPNFLSQRSILIEGNFDVAKLSL